MPEALHPTVCVYCSSSRHVDQGYLALAETLGMALAQSGRSLVFGGTDTGCMAAVARSAKNAGGYVTGVIPQSMIDRGIAFQQADELVTRPDMASRKMEMARLADAFIALPGGFGTLEELVEIVTLKHLQYHSKPILLLNHQGFYDKLLAFFEQLYETHFAGAGYRGYMTVVSDIAEAIALLDAAGSVPQVDKWS